MPEAATQTTRHLTLTAELAETLFNQTRAYAGKAVYSPGASWRLIRLLAADGVGGAAWRADHLAAINPAARRRLEELEMDDRNTCQNAAHLLAEALRCTDGPCTLETLLKVAFDVGRLEAELDRLEPGLQQMVAGMQMTRLACWCADVSRLAAPEALVTTLDQR